MPGTDDHGERLAVVETNVEHIDKRLEKIEAQVQVVHDFVTQAKGARWLFVSLIAAASVIGGAASWAVSMIQTLRQS